MKIIQKIKISNKKIVHIMKLGINFSFILCLIAIYILETYCIKGVPLAFYTGISLFQSGIFFITMFIMCGIVFNKILEN